MEPKRRLSDIDVMFISLVDKGANLKRIIYKSDDLPDEPPISKTVEILKTDVEKHMVYGIVYSPDETDSQGDITTAAEIEKAAHSFLKHRRVGMIDKNHNQQPGEGWVAESWIIRGEDPLLKGEAPEGSWAVAIKIDNDQTWEEIKKGEIGGLSLMGRAATESLEKSDDNTNIWHLIKQKLGLEDVDKSGRMISAANKKLIQTTIDALAKLITDSTVEKGDVEMTPEDKAEIAKMIEDSVAKAYAKSTEETKKALNDKFDATVASMNATIAKHEAAFAELEKSKGSAQVTGQEAIADEAAELEKRGQYKGVDGKVHNHVFA